MTMTALPAPTLLADYLAEQRWFGGKGRPFAVTGVVPRIQATDLLWILLVEVTYADEAGGTERYQLPISRYPDPVPGLEGALISSEPGLSCYDAVHDRAASATFLRLFTGELAANAPLQVHHVGDLDLDPTAIPAFLPVEQSNTSLVFGEEALLKLFRKVTAGPNPDIEIHRALTEAGDPHVARLYGWLSDGEHDLGMLQQFLRTASDGWDLAKASARNLLTADTLQPEEVGGDFAAEAARLGAAVASIHAVLRERFGASTLDAVTLAEAMERRLTAARVIAPELDEFAAALSDRYQAIAALGPAVPAQRIHGDLHLGQTLRTSLGWKVVDFEGEPAKTLAERTAPDSVWRDVAGMLRSFSYAAASTALDLEPADPAMTAMAHQATAWVSRNVSAFTDGYLQERDAVATPAETTLLHAYLADKAVYEVVYEARNRPDWAAIPLAGIRRMCQEAE